MKLLNMWVILTEEYFFAGPHGMLTGDVNKAKRWYYKAEALKARESDFGKYEAKVMRLKDAKTLRQEGK